MKKRNKKAHQTETKTTDPLKQKVFKGFSVEGIAIYVWIAIPKGFEHDLSS